MKNTIILGAGVTGLAAAIKTGAPIYEANSYPGGICHSYTKKGYHFEAGGGRWLFEKDKSILKFVSSLSSLKYYQRKSAVFFPQKNSYIPFPLQNHLSYLPPQITNQVAEETKEIEKRRKTLNPKTLKEWLEINFGKTLCKLFFFPFHQLYTAGLYRQIAPQDQFKTPVGSKNLGYNKTFAYPKRGLSDLIQKMAQKCQINYRQKAISIDIKKKIVFFKNGKRLKYKKIISTLPLNQMIKLTGIHLDEPPDPYTSILVINIGAEKGKKCPSYHWLYLPKSNSGFHRIGFYSNVDSMFLPPSQRNKVSLYVEKAYLGGKKPKSKEIKKLTKEIVKELKEWEFIKKAEAIDTTWIEVAYTWSFPNSKWREKAIKILEGNDIFQIGRYGRWQFQGILESIKDGLTFPKKLLF